jgi:hypothetical protein
VSKKRDEEERTKEDKEKKKAKLRNANDSCEK